MYAGIAIFAVLALVLLGIGGLGLFLGKRLGSEPQEKKHETSSEKLAEWQSAAASYDAGKATEERLMAHESYQAASALAASVAGRTPERMVLKANLQSLDEYRSFDPDAYLKAHVDRDEAAEWLELSGRMLALQGEMRSELDRACVMMEDEPDAAVKKACRDKILEAIGMMRDDLLVRYSYAPGNGKAYRDEAAVGVGTVRAMAGMPAGGRRGTLLERFLALEGKGFRCERCGRSPLSGAELEMQDSPLGPECLCQDCRA